MNTESKMRGGIISRYPGSYSFVIDEPPDPVTGKRRQRWYTVRGSRREAERQRTELQNSRNRGTYVQPDKMPMRDYLDKWLEEYAKPTLTSRSYDRYASLVKVHLKPSIGNLPLSELRPDVLQTLYTRKLAAGLKPASVKYIHTVLHKALNVALQWGLVSRNVADAVSPPKTHRAEIAIWNETEVAKFLEASQKTAHYALFYSAVYTGARRGELLALSWNDVDFLYSQITVRRSLHYLKGDAFMFSEPKTAKSRRTIAMPPSLVKVLSEYRAWQVELYGSVADNDLVFSNHLGKPLRPTSVTRAWGNTARRAGVPVIRFHDARHTHASLMLKQGVNPKVVQERLGHSNIGTTLDIYSHVIPGLQEQAAKAFDFALGSQV